LVSERAQVELKVDECKPLLEGFVTAKFRDRAALQLKSGGVMPAYTAGSYTRQSNPF